MVSLKKLPLIYDSYASEEFTYLIEWKGRLSSTFILFLTVLYFE